MEIIAPTNWDDELIRGYRDLPVADVYGSVPDATGGGRAGFLLGRTTRRALARHVRLVRDQGRTFTYLMNAPSLGGDLYDAAFRRRLADRLRWLRDAGVTGVTVSIPLLAEIVREVVPELKVKVSVIAHVDSIARVRFYEGLGVDEITLDFNITRRLSRIREIHAASKATLSLLANDLCLMRCPMRQVHYDMVGHSSRSRGAGTGEIIDDCFMRCHSYKLTWPVELLKSPWLRPEDTARVTQETGVTRFKLAGRTKNTTTILKIVRAYAEGRHDGNLLEVLESTSTDDATGLTALAQRAFDHYPGLAGRTIRLASELQARLPKARRHAVLAVFRRLPVSQIPALARAYLSLTGFQDAVHIDNAALDGFLDALNEARCDGDCGPCRVCDAWAARAITVDDQKADRIRRSLDEALGALVRGDLVRR